MLHSGLGLFAHVPDVVAPLRRRGTPDNVVAAGGRKIWPTLRKQTSSLKASPAHPGVSRQVRRHIEREFAK